MPTKRRGTSPSNSKRPSLYAISRLSADYWPTTLAGATTMPPTSAGTSTGRRHLRAATDEGTEGGLDEIRVGPNGVLCRLHVDWPDSIDRRRREGFFHLYSCEDGQIAEIRRYDDATRQSKRLARHPLTRRHNATRANKNSNRLTRFFLAIRAGDLQSLERLVTDHPQMLSVRLGGDTGAARCSTSRPTGRVLPERAAGGPPAHRGGR